MEAVSDVTVVRVGVGLEAWDLLCLQSCYILRGEPVPPVHFTDAETEPCRRAVACPGSLSKTMAQQEVAPTSLLSFCSLPSTLQCLTATEMEGGMKGCVCLSQESEDQREH